MPTTWDEPDDTELNEGKPNAYSLLRRIRDLARALSEGAAGAPKIQAAALLDGSITPAKLQALAAGPYQEGSRAWGETTTASYVKQDEIYVPRAGTVRVRLRLWIESLAGSAGAGFVRVYINGVAQGAERSVSFAPDPAIGDRAFNEWDEDFGVAAGDLVQLYMATNTTAIRAEGEMTLHVAAPLLPGTKT